jgi:hypothetical protein
VSLDKARVIPIYPPSDHTNPTTRGVIGPEDVTTVLRAALYLAHARPESGG